MELKCIKKVEGFTIGRNYEMLGCAGEYVQLKADDGKESILFESYFQIMEGNKLDINNKSGYVDGTYLIANGFAKSWNNAKKKSEVKKLSKTEKFRRHLRLANMTSVYNQYRIEYKNKYILEDECK